MKIFLVCEDLLSEAVMRKMVHKEFSFEVEYFTLGKRGRGFIKKNINRYNQASNTIPFFVLTDLDHNECAAGLKENWLPHPINLHMIFRIAVREVETWLLADTEGFSKFMKLDIQMLNKETINLESIMDPKEKLISLAHKSKDRSIREDIIPKDKNSQKQGPAYNTRLTAFVNDFWNIDRARKKSQSLSSALKALTDYKFKRGLMP